MSKQLPPSPEPARQRAITLAHLVALVQARRTHNARRADHAARELERRGVLVRFPRPSKGVERD